jgi:hypothetical protein
MKLNTGPAPIQRQIRLPGGRINSDRQKIHQGKMFVEPNNGTFVKIPVGSRKLPHLGGPTILIEAAHMTRYVGFLREFG